MTSLCIEEFRDSLSNENVLIDLRSQEEFTSGFLPGSIFFELDQVSHLLGVFFNSGDKIVFIVPAKQLPLLKAQIATIREGLQLSFFEAENWNWDHQKEIDMIIDVDGEELGLDMKFDDHIILADLRDASDFETVHLAGSTSIPLKELSDVAQIAGLDEGGTIYLYGKNNADSITAASLLKKHGIHQIRVVKGGWKTISEEPSIEKVYAKQKKS
ncbi:MAG: rhodanese-like domain-containing protein [Chitinophagaceae bacterium]|nr:rhodanese-like domain-containing protein [Chitinophagaceae bacterium]